jgi:hypothetical protein
MMGETQYGLPLIVGNFTGNAARGLKRVRFEKGDDDGYKERWIQRLVSRYPSVLPIEQIEPALTPAIPICMELPLASGFVDNLYATPDGDGAVSARWAHWRPASVRRRAWRGEPSRVPAPGPGPWAAAAKRRRGPWWRAAVAFPLVARAQQPERVPPYEWPRRITSCKSSNSELKHGQDILNMRFKIDVAFREMHAFEIPPTKPIARLEHG